MRACPLIIRLFFFLVCSQNIDLSGKSFAQLQSQEMNGRYVKEKTAVWSRNYSRVLAARKKFASIPSGQAWHRGPAQT